MSESPESNIQTALPRAEDARAFAESVLRTVHEPLLVLGEDLEVIFANERYYQAFRVSPANTLGKRIYDLGNHHWEIPELKRAIDNAAPGDSEFTDLEVQGDFPSLGRRNMVLNGRRIHHGGDGRSLVFLAIQDQTEQKHAQEALRESERSYRGLVEKINSIVIKTDKNGIVTFVNPFAENFFGLSCDEIIGQPLIGGLIPAEQLEHGGSDILPDVLTSPDDYHIRETEIQRSDGRSLLFSWSVKAVKNELGEVTALLIDGNDLTPTLGYRRRLDDALELIEHTPDAIASFDRAGRVEFMNRALVELVGFSEPTKDKTLEELANAYPTATWMLKGYLEAKSTGRTTIAEVSINAIWIQSLALPKKAGDGTVASVMIFGRDITAIKQYQQALTHEAMHDPLTALPNRRTLERRLDEEWRRTARHDEALSLLLVDVDYFKAYNDHYGHLAGDECLRKVAKLLQRSLHRPADIVARYGGEEFMILLPETPPDGARKMGEEILRAFADAAIPHAASPIAPYVTVSIGLTGTIPRRSSPRAAFSLADQALYRAKERGRNRIEMVDS